MKKQSPARMSDTISSEICKWIESRGSSHVFLVPGLQIEPLCIEITAHKKLSAIVACHELGAGFMADGYARASNKTGVCVSIGGPGASYMLPSAMVSRVDESMVLYITGDVPTRLKDYLCFQDTGLPGSRDRQAYEALIDFTKTINNPEDTFPVLDQIDGRLRSKLPAHLVIPCDIQESAIGKMKKNTACDTNGTEALKDNDQHCIALTLVDMIRNAKHPVMLVGHRLFNKAGIGNLKHFAEFTGIRVATTYRAKGIFPEDHSLSLGGFGYAGTQLSHNAILGNDCDLIIVLGLNVSQRDTFHFHERFFLKGRKGIVIDTANSLSDSGWQGYQKFITHDISSVLESALAIVKGSKIKKKAFVAPSVNSGNIPAPINSSFKGAIGLGWVLFRLRNAAPSNTMFFVDSGAHRVFAGTAWKVTEPFTFFTSDLEAPMGWAICAAIGAKLARPQSPAIVLTGDGCMRMHAMEIATAVRYSIPVIFMVSNNAAYYFIQKRVPTKEAKEKLGKLPLINWMKFAQSIGAEGCVVSKPSELDRAIKQALGSKKPFVIDLRTHPEEPFPDFTTIPDSVWPNTAHQS